jgi:hypothetical protein
MAQFAMSTSYATTPEEADAIVAHLWAEADEMIRGNLWAAVQKLADQLLADGVMTGKEICEYVSKALGSSRNVVHHGRMTGADGKTAEMYRLDT